MLTVDEVHRRLRAAGTGGREKHSRGYTPSKLTFLGVAVPDI